MPRVLLTRALPIAGLAPLREAGVAVEILADQEPAPRQELVAAVAGVDALITLVSDRVDAELLDAAGPTLKIVANYAVGVNNIDFGACRARGVAVSNTPDVLTGATADLAFALLLAVARRLLAGDAMVRSGTWSGWQPDQLLGLSVEGATLGIVGMGRIGGAVARRAQGFGMRIIYHNRSAAPELEAQTGARRSDLETLLRESDFVSLHCPLTPATHHLIDAEALALMKPTAVLINSARGPLVDECALAEALAGGQVWGAGLDVFEREPEVEQRLVALENVLLAPHIGSATEAARTAMARLCAEAVVAVLAGGEPANLVSS